VAAKGGVGHDRHLNRLIGLTIASRWCQALASDRFDEALARIEPDRHRGARSDSGASPGHRDLPKLAAAIRREQPFSSPTRS
jgi:hypothetical protein